MAITKKSASLRITFKRLKLCAFPNIANKVCKQALLKYFGRIIKEDLHPQ